MDERIKYQAALDTFSGMIDTNNQITDTSRSMEEGFKASLKALGIANDIEQHYTYRSGHRRI